MAKNFMCTLCERDVFFDTKKQMIAHYEKKHPFAPSALYDAIGETWLPEFDEVVEELRAAKAELTPVKKQVEDLTQKYQELVNRWNAVLFVMNAK